MGSINNDWLRFSPGNRDVLNRRTSGNMFNKQPTVLCLEVSHFQYHFSTVDNQFNVLQTIKHKWLTCSVSIQDLQDVLITSLWFSVLMVSDLQYHLFLLCGFWIPFLYAIMLSLFTAVKCTIAILDVLLKVVLHTLKETTSSCKWRKIHIKDFVYSQASSW
jgi:hypothetical protein